MIGCYYINHSRQAEKIQFQFGIMNAAFRFCCLLVLLALVGVAASAAPPTFTIKNQRLILANGFVYLEFDEAHPSINVIKADFSGEGHYGSNLVATNSPTETGIVLETVDETGKVHCASPAASHITYKILRKNAAELSVQIRGLQDQETNPALTGIWTISLPASSRKFTLTTKTVVARSQPMKAIKIGAYLNQWFMNGFFQRGVMQYVNSGNQLFFTTNLLHTFYTMDNNNGSVAIVPRRFPNTTAWAMRSCDDGNGAALETILAGHYPTIEQWSRPDWESATNEIPPAGETFQTRLDIYPNNYAFPVFRIPADDPMRFRDLRTLYTAIYGSAAGVLGSFKYDGSAYPTLQFPKRPYGDLFTFFDPDSWSTVATLSFSGDPYLQNQARRIVELAAANLRDGQIPHHFIAGKPTYIAISKATQTGPNIFWVLAAIDYADGTGNEAWLREHYPQLKAATDWILKCYDPDRKLVKVGGPLFIDVFIREGYTLDSNAMLLHLLPLMSSVAQFCGDAESASRYDHLAGAIKQGINAGLWNGHDHYVTQRNSDWSIRDMVDYDGNYAAIAFGAATNSERIAAMYHRLDGGSHTHPGNRGTWVSEKYYGAKDCYGGNTGDSATAMARIWWLDMDSRYITGDLTNFDKYFEPIQNDLLQHTWLTERYNAEGKLIRAPYYHEYPEITAMILREMIYGIDIKIDCVRIKPFGLTHYHYQIGNMDVSYSPNEVTLHIPGHNNRTYEIYGLLPNKNYFLSTGQKTLTDSAGTTVFEAPVGQTITLRSTSTPSPRTIHP
jgi:Bacterial alpha-L-rhamnosidase 6 hairpin glycosidase domain